MSLPTLLKRDVIIPHMKEKKDEIQNITGIDFVMNWFGNRINNPNKIKSISDRIVILKSATGSGKSTVLPTELYLRFNKEMRKSIIVTQPRILTAISIPKDIASIDAYKIENRTDNMGIKLYENIGYQTKEYIKKPLSKGILFCTIGILLQFLKNMDIDKFLNKYGIIMLDEAHDRSTNLDLIFYYLKQLTNTIPLEKCPFIIIASATLDVYKYAKYFNTKTIFEITGTSYPIITNYLKYDSDNIFTKTIEIIKNIHINNKDDNKTNSDIIVFIPSKSYIKKIKEKILELNETLENKILPVSLDSAIYKSANIDYQYLFEDIKNLTLEDSKIKPTRRVIISTNIAETGITLESLKYCIDLGLVNQLEYNPIINSSLLAVKPVTKSMALQRKGRVGRKQPGEFYPIYTDEIFNKLIDIQYPEIFTEDITITLLNIIIVKYTKTINKYNDLTDLFNNINSKDNKYNDIKFIKNIDINTIDLLDNPSQVSINNSLEKLYVYGAIYANGYPTQMGLIINKIRMLSIENIKMILSGYHYGCNISDLITIACFIQTSKNNIIMTKFKSFNNQFDDLYDGKSMDNYNINILKSRLFISCEFIDFLLFFYKFKKVIIANNNNVSKIKDFCELNKVNYLSLMNFIELRDDVIKDFLFNMNMNPFANSHINLDDLLNSYKTNENLFEESIEEIMKIKKCIYEGYKLNIATYNSEKNKYISDYNGYELNINSYLVKNLPILNNGKNFNMIKPKHILYDSLLIKKNPISNNYDITVSNCISVLSGYVNIDFDFNKN